MLIKKSLFTASALHTTETFYIILIIINYSILENLVKMYKDIQGDSGGICNTLGNDSMCDSKQKSLYEHGFDFGRLRSYDFLNLRIEGNDY